MEQFDFSHVHWLRPWFRLADPAASRALEQELAREVCPRHCLYGAVVTAVARRMDADDVLFLVTGDRPVLAVVHLTWTGCQGSSAAYPATTFFASVETWVERVMKSDHRAEPESLER